MDDFEIVNLFWERDEKAISETSKKYGNYCKSIADSILHNDQDSKECENETYYRAWKSIPPHRPKVLSAFLGKIIRRIAFDKLRKRNALKRGGGEIDLVLGELAECISSQESIEDNYEFKELTLAINDFLSDLSPVKRNMFILRYWYSCPISKISDCFNLTEHNVTVILSRTREKMKKYLKERGYDL